MKSGKCEKCGKLLEDPKKFFCTECEEKAVQKLAEMMEKELKKSNKQIKLT